MGLRLRQSTNLALTLTPETITPVINKGHTGQVRVIPNITGK
jgi:hypothetical protein